MSERVKLIFPTDFSDESMKAFDMARLFAKTYKAELFLLHVLEAPSGAMKLFSNYDEAEARKKAITMLQELVTKFPEDGFEYTKMIKTGKPYKAIIDAATEVNANAIIMGTHGDSGLHEIIVGSNASRVIRSAPCHVFTLKHKPNPVQMNKIVLPLDLTKETGEKVNLGIEFAQNFGAELVVMTVLMTDDEEIRKRLQNRMDTAVDFIKKHGVQRVAGEMVVTKSDIATAVLDHAYTIKADMVLIMTQQEMGLKEHYLGSSADKIVNHSSIPVMAVKPKRHYRERNYSSAVWS